MADILPTNIPVPQSAAIASFNYTDIAEGTGVVKFYAATNFRDSTKYFYLTTNAVNSNNVVTSGSTIAAGPNTGRIQTQSYDVVFNRPQNVKGTCYLNITIGGHSNTANGQKIWISGATLQRSGATSVDNITATVSGGMYTFIAAAPATESVVQLISIPLTESTHFKAGEALRLNLDLWGVSSTTGALDYGGWGNDPQDRDDLGLTIESTDTTKMELYVPFLLNTV